MDIINIARMDLGGKGGIWLKNPPPISPTSGFSFVTDRNHDKVTRRRF